MESLLCNEAWTMSPIAAVDDRHEVNDNDGSFCQAEEDLEQTFRNFLEKEASYMPQQGYVKHVNSNNCIDSARFRAICWLIKSQKRLNLSLGTIFNAANYLDRFISQNQCYGWKLWTFELVSVACLSVASKFNETNSSGLYEFEMEGVKHCFESSLIQRVELALLRSLGWRLRPITPCSYTEMLTSTFCSLNNSLSQEFTERVNELLLSTLLDSKFLEFRPCVIAVSAMRLTFEQLLPSANYASLAHFVSWIPQDHKDDLMKCQEMMDKQLRNEYSLLSHRDNYYCPSSPVTVLTVEQLDSACGSQFDPSLFKMRPQVDFTIPSCKRRKIQEWQ